jgi:hypothetical protein
VRLFSLDPGSPIKATAAGVVIVACAFVLDRFCDAVSFSLGPRTFPPPGKSGSISEGLCHAALTPLLWIAAGGVLLLVAGLALVRWGGASGPARRFAGAALLLSRIVALVLFVVTLVTLLAYRWLDLSRW